jgi:hypothetical protein
MFDPRAFESLGAGWYSWRVLIAGSRAEGAAGVLGEEDEVKVVGGTRDELGDGMDVEGAGVF